MLRLSAWSSPLPLQGTCLSMPRSCGACVLSSCYRHGSAHVSIYADKLAQETKSCSKSHEPANSVYGVLQQTHKQHTWPCRNILAVVGPPDSGKSALVAAMCGRLYKPAKATGKILISGKEAYESFKPTWFSANDVLTSHLTVHQYLLYKGICQCHVDHLACTDKGCSISHLPDLHRMQHDSSTLR